MLVRTKNNGGSTVSLLLLDEDENLLIDGAFDEATYDTFDDDLIRSLSIETSPSSPAKSLKTSGMNLYNMEEKDLMDGGILGKISPEERGRSQTAEYHTTFQTT